MLLLNKKTKQRVLVEIVKRVLTEQGIVSLDKADAPDEVWVAAGDEASYRFHLFENDFAFTLYTHRKNERKPQGCVRSSPMTERLPVCLEQKFISKVQTCTQVAARIINKSRDRIPLLQEAKGIVRENAGDFPLLVSLDFSAFECPYSYSNDSSIAPMELGDMDVGINVINPFVYKEDHYNSFSVDLVKGWQPQLEHALYVLRNCARSSAEKTEWKFKRLGLQIVDLKDLEKGVIVLGTAYEEVSGTCTLDLNTGKFIPHSPFVSKTLLEALGEEKALKGLKSVLRQNPDLSTELHMYRRTQELLKKSIPKVAAG